MRTIRVAWNDEFKHVLVAGLLQSIEEATVNIARLVYDNIQQFFSCFDWLLVFGLNGMEFFQCESVTLKHVTCDDQSIKFLWHVFGHATQHRSVIYNTNWPVDGNLCNVAVFTAPAYARAVLRVVILSVCPFVCLSVRLSVCPSVTRVDCDKYKWCSADILIPHERTITLLLWYQQWLSLIHIWRCRRSYACRSRWSPYH